MTNEDATLPVETPGGRLDLGSLFGFAFRDPMAFRKWGIGCLAVLLIPVFGLGLLLLLGFAVQTARGALRGDEHPMPGWNAWASQLADGLRAVAVVLVYGAVVAVVGGALFLVSFLIGMIAVGIAGGVLAGVVGAVTEIGVGPDVFGEILPELVAVPVAGAGLIGAAAVFGLVVTGWFVVLAGRLCQSAASCGVDATGRHRPDPARARLGQQSAADPRPPGDLHPAPADPRPVRHPRQCLVVALPGGPGARPLLGFHGFRRCDRPSRTASWASRWKPRRTDRRYR